MLGGESDYNRSNLDRFLVTTKEIKPEKKIIRKILPALHDQYTVTKKNKNRLSKADESFY